jgi:DegV family protein with EDD domain
LITIITDSTCDVPEDLIEKYQIRIVPHVIIWGEEEFRDRVDLSPQQFYQRLAVDPQRPTTSQATVADFLSAVNDAQDEGATEVVILTVSSAMSGAYQMACQAAERADIPISVIDSKGPTITLGWQALAAARARDEGASQEDIVERAAEVRSRLVQIVAMESLDYLQTGGRIGDAAKWVGTLLNVKPVVAINHQTGKVEPVGLARSHKAMVRMLYSKFFKEVGHGRGLHIAVLHGNALEEAQKLAERIQNEFNPVEMIINITGPVLGINTGPGALALCGYLEE